jgi:hypothetical protein
MAEINSNNLSLGRGKLLDSIRSINIQVRNHTVPGSSPIACNSSDQYSDPQSRGSLDTLSNEHISRLRKVYNMLAVPVLAS